MSSCKLASAGDDIKLWDTRSFTVVKQFNPHDHNVAELCWSHDSILLINVTKST